LSPEPSDDPRASARRGRRARSAGAVAAFVVMLLALIPPEAAAAHEALFARHGFAPEAVAVVVEEVDGGRRLVAHRAAEPGPAASTLKLATALFALDTLGPEHRFVTRLLVTGPVDSAGRLAGDLIIAGGGDPLLDIDGLLALAMGLRDAGIRSVAGRFVLDDGLLPRLPQINPAQPVEAGYNAGIGALSLAFNRVQRPAGGAFTIPALRERGPAWRRLPTDRPAVVPVRDAGLHAALVLRDLAASLGVALPEPERGASPAGARLAASVASRPLRDIVQAMLLYSNNQIAEIIGLAATGEASLGASAAQVAAALRAALPEIDWRGFRLTNHSGLDPGAQASADQLLAILRLAEAGHVLLPLLPAAGWSGSLESRFRNPEAALRVWAKTGSLDFAAALAGYVLPPSGRLRRIVVLITDAAGRRARDAVELPDATMRRAIDDFMVRARELRDDLAIWALTLGD
jgi:D-alanyl-D-alanine carboxypeptidase/D-alanyl-D-alanine-endopeptidase (penicillin-binding protein 4)